MTERDDLPLIGMPDETKKGDTKAKAAPSKGGVATVGAPKAETEKPVHRRETTRLPAPSPRPAAPRSSPHTSEAGKPAPAPKPAPRVLSAEEKANAAAETAIDEDFGLNVEAPAAPKGEQKAAPTPPTETSDELVIVSEPVKPPTKPDPAPVKQETTRSSAPAKPAIVARPTVVLKGDPAQAEAKPAVVSEPTSRRDLSMSDDPEELLAHLQKRVREAKSALTERDEARNKAARLEHELAQEKERVGQLQPLEEEVKEFKTKLDAATLAAKDAGTLDARVKELEGQARQLEERAKTAEATVKKQETALANAKEARDDAQRRVEAAIAALQGKKA